MSPARAARCEADAGRRIVLEAALASGTCHIGSSLSIVDILTVLYAGRPARPALATTSSSRRATRPRALYAVLARTASSTARGLAGYCSDGGMLPGHPERGIPGVELTAGSLGHGARSRSGTRSPTAPTAPTAARTASSATASSTRARSGRPSRWPAISRPPDLTPDRRRQRLPGPRPHARGARHGVALREARGVRLGGRRRRRP